MSVHKPIERAQSVFRRFRRTLTIGVLLIASLLGIGVVYERVSSRRDAARFPPPGKLVDVGGRRLHLLCVGVGSPVVIFEAGATHDSMEYASIQEEVGKHTRACAYDRAGMGWSDPNPAPLHARNLSEDLGHLLEAASIQAPYIFVAGSAGGLTVELYSRTHPRNVVGLVWLDALTGGIVDDLGDASGSLVRRAALARLLANVGAIRFFDPHGLGGLPTRERELAFARAYHRAPWDAVYSLVSSSDASASEIRAEPPLPLDMPLVVVVHERAEGVHAEPGVEARWQEAQARFARSSSRGRLVVAHGSGHHPEEDRADLVTREILGLLEETRR